MGCAASKDGLVSNRKSRPAQPGRSMSMPVQAHSNSDNGFHMVALASSTYGILKVDEDGANDFNFDTKPDSAHDAFYEKLKNFDVPEDMVAKPWSEVSRNLPKIPPPTRTDSPRRSDSPRQVGALRGMDSPRQTGRSFRGTDSPRQTGRSFRGTDSPRLAGRNSFRRASESPYQLPSQTAKTDHETINLWELMDGLEEDGTGKSKPKIKSVDRVTRSPMIKPFERSVTFSTIHTLSELDSEDPSKAIALGSAGNVLSSIGTENIGTKENGMPGRAMSMPARSPIISKRSDHFSTVTPSSPAPLSRTATPKVNSLRPRQPIVAPMALTPEVNASIQEVSNAVSKVLLPPPSPSVRPVSANKMTSASPNVARPRQPNVAPMTLTPEANSSIQEVSSAVSKVLLPPPSPSVRPASANKMSSASPNVAPMTLTPEANSSIQEVSNAVSKVLLPPPSPSVRPVSANKMSSASPNVARPRQPNVAPMALSPEVNASIREVSAAVNKALLQPPPSSVPSAPNKVSAGSPRVAPPQQHTTAQMTLAPEVKASVHEANNAPLRPPSPVLRSVGTRNASVTQARNKPPELQPRKSPMLKAEKPLMSLNTKLEAEVEKAISQERSANPRRSQSTTASSGSGAESNRDLGRVRVPTASFGQEGEAARPEPTSGRIEVDESSNQPTRQLPRFASPIHVLSLAASFELENRKNSISQADLRVPPLSPGPTSTKAGGFGQTGRQSFSKQQSTPKSPKTFAPSPGPGVGFQSQAPIPSPVSHSSYDSNNATGGDYKSSQLAENGLSSRYVDIPSGEALRKSKVSNSPSVKGYPEEVKGISSKADNRPIGASERSAGTNVTSSLFEDGVEDPGMDSDLLASFEEALEMFSTDEWYEVRGSKNGATQAPAAVEKKDPSPLPSDRQEDRLFAEKVTQGNGNKGTTPKAIVPPRIVKPDPWARFEKKCPPAGEDRIVLYTTSLRGIRKTFEDCNNARFIFESFNVEIDERDVSIHAEFRQELKDIAGTPLPVPQAFIKGHYIGGAETISQLHEDGTLATLVDGIPPQRSREECDGCGGVRFVPCSDCSGSTKVVNDAKEVVRCSECNENGLMRCPICY